MTDTVKGSAGSNEERIAKLEAELAELKKAQEPKPPFKPEPFERFDPTARASMSPQTMRELAAAVGTGLVQQVVGDFRSGPAAPKSQAEGAATKSVGSAGWVEPTPLSSPPGQKLIEEIADHFDRKDRAKGL